jgi:hypothetical protein
MALAAELGYDVALERRPAMNYINKDQFLGVVRHIVTFIGGVLVARGKLDVGSVETIVGFITTVTGLIFSFIAPEKTQTTASVTVTETINKPQ